MQWNRKVVPSCWIIIFVVLTGIGVTFADSEQNKKKGLENGDQVDILAQYGYRAYGGSAAGYIDDASCSAGGCHAELVRDFAGTDKARSFLKPKKENFVAEFNRTFYHDLSMRYYKIVQNGDDLIFHRWQVDEDGKRINAFKVKVDWLHGSGTLARAYLLQVPDGSLFQLPLIWNGTTKEWNMGPGYDLKHHIGIKRQVRRECQFCHNGYSELPENGDDFDAPDLFPKNITRGIGCQRCHGPGAEHTRLGLLALDPANKVEPAALLDSILNQEKLSPELNDEVCNQCHERTAKMVPKLVRFGRGTFSYRPGDPLGDYMVNVHVTRAGTKMAGRIGAISQPPRTRESRCYIESGGKLTCIVCHDSHRRIPEAERAEFYRNACYKCHSEDQCTVKRDESSSTDYLDCIACHMPRLPSTVKDFPITDHRIVKNPETGISPTPLRGKETIITEAWVSEDMGEQGELYRLSALVDASGGMEIVKRLEKEIRRIQPEFTEPYFILAKGYSRFKQWDKVNRVVDRILKIEPGNKNALELKAVALFSMGGKGEALKILQQRLEEEKNRSDLHFNLGLFLLSMERTPEAKAALERALELNPYIIRAWYYSGMVNEMQGQSDKALENYRRALEIEPGFGRGYLALGRLLLREGQGEEARRYLRHGKKYARNPVPVAEACEALDVSTPKEGPAHGGPSGDNIRTQ